MFGSRDTGDRIGVIVGSWRRRYETAVRLGPAEGHRFDTKLEWGLEGRYADKGAHDRCCWRQPPAEENLMSRVEKTLEVNVPIRVAYDQWTQFEDFPRFMDGVKSVQQLDDTHLHWKAEIAGQQKDWDAKIVAQRPDEMVAWTSTSGARNAGVVRFERASDDVTRITLEMDVDPEGPMENLGDFLGVLDRLVEGDLQRFKEFIESRGAPTGAWRGTTQGSSSD